MNNPREEFEKEHGIKYYKLVENKQVITFEYTWYLETKYALQQKRIKELEDALTDIHNGFYNYGNHFQCTLPFRDIHDLVEEALKEKP